MPIPQTGNPAPDFQLQDQNGNDVKLSKLRGKNVVLYFYPKDDTSGCTREACDFRDEHSALQAAGAVVLGVSPDDTKSHLKFATKYSLPFPLLADTERKVCDAYGVWGEKSLYGRKFMGVTRATFLIDTEGKVARVWPKVKVQGHVQEILQSLQGGAPEGEKTGASGAAAEPARKKSATKKVSAKKAAPAGRTVVKKAATKKPAAKKSAAKKSTVRR
ncbi:thioredoxin-dependent thiol peroxidase [Archangium lansingense]|uniref:thioredoxin-dependent peroxiredoxin n=1 Tax=Archangium lansingense TaxID=2995310 RepID=A0ABT4AK91_9BACT|nr:thioredoxin-dependent thiol peroxidase [Archangium lansinium]MCY1082110.1 thioredoxin-dependent thiol peroxidase [Archangium lansinium]